MFLKLLSTNGTLEPTAEETAKAVRFATAQQAKGEGGPVHLDILINGRINRELCSVVETQLKEAPAAQSIALYIDSEGGECGPSIDLHILIRRHPAPLKVAHLLGRCESAALLVALAADRRVAQGNTSVLLHNAAYEAIDIHSRWTAKHLETLASELQSIDDDFNAIMSQRTGCPVSAISVESKTEDQSSLRWCLDNGFIHEVQS